MGDVLPLPAEPAAPDAAVDAIAADSVTFLAEADPADGADTAERAVTAASLSRLGRLLAAQRQTSDLEVASLCARATLETWLTGHAALLLDPTVLAELECRAEVRRVDAGLAAQAPTAVPTLFDLARRLDVALYGVADPPKAFQRHLRSFHDEIDIGGVEGDLRRLRGAAGPGGSVADHVRVSLWVTLFLAHDHFADCNRDAEARRARSLFDALRAATDDWYSARRRA